MAAKTFTVTHGILRIRVRVLPTIADVHREWLRAGGTRRRDGKVIPAFFRSTQSPYAKTIGLIVLPLDGRLGELVPHEVTHAVLHKVDSVHCVDDEKFATAVGLLSARIFKRIEQMGVAV